jgi:formylglycine-generating enzyme required for sulfatase activity
MPTPTFTPTSLPTPDGLITYFTQDGDKKSLYVLNPDSAPTALIEGVADIMILDVSPDRRYVALAVSAMSEIVRDERHPRFLNSPGMRLIVVSVDGRVLNEVLPEGYAFDAAYNANGELLVAVLHSATDPYHTVDYAIAKPDGSELAEFYSSQNYFPPTPTPTLTPTTTPAPTTLYVPAGDFTMGEGDSEHIVYVDAFWIMRTEVTNAQYAHCVADGVCQEPNNERWNNADYADHPVTDVNWYQANVYARWAGGRLPSEAEWEKACRTTDRRIYPWGDQEPNDQLLNYNWHVGGTTPVGGYLEGASPYGVLDMAGNVSEWTSSLLGDYPYRLDDGRENVEAPGPRVVRGGSFGHDAHGVNCLVRYEVPEDAGGMHDGFRIVMSAPGQ